MMRFAYVSLFLLLFLGPVAIAQSPDTPIWMGVGKYAEYAFESVGIWFLNGTIVDFEDETSAVFRWKCVDLNDTEAKFVIEITYTGEKQKIRLSSEVYINLASRGVMLPNGTYLGKTRLWLPAYPTQDEDIILWDHPLVYGKVIDVGGGMTGTPQGSQRIFIVEASGAICGRSWDIGGFYDIDTGVAIDPSLDCEPTLLALGIVDPRRSGIIRFSDTNIDLGPRDLWPEILDFIIFATPAAILIAVSILLYRRRKRKGRRRPEIASQE